MFKQIITGAGANGNVAYGTQAAKNFKGAVAYGKDEWGMNRLSVQFTDSMEPDTYMANLKAYGEQFVKNYDMDGDGFLSESEWLQRSQNEDIKLSESMQDTNQPNIGKNYKKLGLDETLIEMDCINFNFIDNDGDQKVSPFEFSAYSFLCDKISDFIIELGDDKAKETLADSEKRYKIQHKNNPLKAFKYDGIVHFAEQDEVNSFIYAANEIKESKQIKPYASRSHMDTWAYGKNIIEFQKKAHQTVKKGFEQLA